MNKTKSLITLHGNRKVVKNTICVQKVLAKSTMPVN